MIGTYCLRKVTHLTPFFMRMVHIVSIFNVVGSYDSILFIFDINYYFNVNVLNGGGLE